MNTLPTRPLGRAGFSVSCIALGTVELGLDYGIAAAGDHRRPDEAEATRLLHRALDFGVTFIDTARAYGEAEAIIGRAISGRRDGYVIASKVTTPAELRGEAARGHVRREIEASLAALRTDRVDLMYSHTATVDEIQRGDVFAALEEARRAGKIRAIGASTYGLEAPMAAIRHGGYDCLQVAYSILDRTLEETAFPAARAAGIGIVARSVLLKGVLTHRRVHLPPALDELKTAAAKAAVIATEAGIADLPELAYRYVLANPALSSALVGTARIEELETSASFGLRPPLPAGVASRLRELKITNLDLLNPGKWPAV